MNRAEAPLVGQSISRREDRSLVSGRGRYLDDIHSQGGLHAAFLRSPYAHATIGVGDLDDVRAMPGVVAVYTAKELAALLPGGQRLATGLPSSSIAFTLDRPILPESETVYVGEALAMVVAETRAEAEDAAEMIDLDLDPLDPVADLETAARDYAPKAHTHLPHNRLAHFGFNYGDIDAAFDGAPHVVSRCFRIDRGGAHSMEGRGVLAAPDAMTGQLSVWSSTQTPHALKRHLCALLAPESVGG